jgi:hypothetical protein
VDLSELARLLLMVLADYFLALIIMNLSTQRVPEEQDFAAKYAGELIVERLNPRPELSITIAFARDNENDLLRRDGAKGAIEKKTEKVKKLNIKKLSDMGKESDKKKEVEWARTDDGKKRLLKAGHINEELYRGRPIIGRDSPIDGGVYIGKNQREAIVVDSVKYPEIKKLYEKVRQLAHEDSESASEDEILNATYSVVSEAMKYDQNGVKQIVRKYAAGKDRKIQIDQFIKKGVGVCRHQALVCAVILELFQKEGIIEGKMSVDRNTILGGHAWCRYTNSDEEVIILDVARECFGYLDEVKSKAAWSYARPEDDALDW